MDLPPVLVEAVRSGRAVLVLGAGASMEATTPDKKTAPSATRLAEIISDKWFNGKYRDTALATVGQYAFDVVGQRDLELHLREIFEPLEPTPSHILATSFVWKGLATTNYDRLIEKSYLSAPSPAQRCFPIVSNADRITPEMSGVESVQLLKLHGCVSHVPNALCPLILSHDQYITHRKGRDKLFLQLQAWAYDYHLIFVGQSVTDSDVRAIVLETAETPESRPQFYLITPDVDDIQAHSWAQRRVTALKGTFKDFIGALDKAIPKKARVPLQGLLSLDHPISDNFVVAGAQCSSDLLSYLTHDVQYVNRLDSVQLLTPIEFFRGYNPPWGAVSRGLDIKRDLQDVVLSEVFLLEESERRKRPEIFTVKGASGSGKSVLLQRLAITAAQDFDSMICLYLRESGQLRTQPLAELIEKCKQRIFLFIDNAADRVGQIRSLVEKLGPSGSLLTIVVAERSNEWNVSSRALEDWVVREYELQRLSNREIDDLVANLARYSCLGTYEGRSSEEVASEFRARAYRHLLVALYEVTYGKPLEDIVQDEYLGLFPEEARSLYLTVCVLNRFNVPIRAGVIARIHDLPFEEFRKRFFEPLEHIVYTVEDPYTKDHLYKARHPVIADIVFHTILKSQEERHDRYLKCLIGLNPLFSLDRQLVRNLVHGRSLLEVFPNHDLVVSIFRAARNLFREDHYILQQEAVYEIQRPNGNLRRSLDLLKRAEELAPHDFSIRHSQAELQLHFGDVAKTTLERERHWREAERIAGTLRADRSDSFPHHTSAKVGLRRLQALLSEDRGSSEDFERIVNAIEESLSIGLLRFPNDPYLKEAEAQLGSILADHERVRSALAASFERNKRSVFVAKRLAAIYEQDGAHESAKSVFLQSLEAHPSSSQLHFAYSQFLMRHEGSPVELIHHLQRSFTSGDDNLLARILYGRQLILADRLGDAEAVFQELNDRRSYGVSKRDRLFPLPVRTSGYVKRKEHSYAMVSWDWWSRWVFTSVTDTEDDVWNRISLGQLVTFQIAFNSQGPVAIDLRTS